MSDELRVLDHIASHTEVLREILTDSVAQARQYLFLTNSGAAVALMAFIGASPEIRNSHFAWISLGLFVLGVIVVGVFNLLDYRSRNGEFLAWLKDVDRFAKRQIAETVLFENLNEKIQATRKLLERLAIVAFLCFVLGTAVSVWHFLP